MGSGSWSSGGEAEGSRKDMGGQDGGEQESLPKINEQFIKSIFFPPRRMASLHFSACFEFHVAM